MRKFDKESAAFRKFLAKALRNDKQHLDIYDLLIMPVQRIPRYIMLLQVSRKSFLRNCHSHPSP